jgi:hypothetical protein
MQTAAAEFSFCFGTGVTHRFALQTQRLLSPEAMRCCYTGSTNNIMTRSISYIAAEQQTPLS